MTVTACCALSLSLHHFYSYLLHLRWSTKGVSAEIQGIHQVKLEPQPWISLSDSSVKEVIVYKVLFLTAPFPSFCTEVTRPTCQSETKWRISWNSFFCWLKARFLFVTENGYGEKTLYMVLPVPKYDQRFNIPRKVLTKIIHSCIKTSMQMCQTNINNCLTYPRVQFAM